MKLGFLCRLLPHVPDRLLGIGYPKVIKGDARIPYTLKNRYKTFLCKRCGEPFSRPHLKEPHHGIDRSNGIMG